MNLFLLYSSQTIVCRYPGDIKEPPTTPKSSKKAFGILQRTIAKHKKANKYLRTVIARKDKKIKTLSMLCEQLKMNSDISDNGITSLEVNILVLEAAITKYFKILNTINLYYFRNSFRIQFWRN